MRYRNLYVILILLLLAVFRLDRLDLYSSGAVTAGEKPGEYPAFWDQTVADYINKQQIQLIVDGKKQKGVSSLYMTPGREVMLPVSMLTKAFSCAVNFYDNTRLVLEKSSIRTELELGEKIMDVNGVRMELKEPLIFQEGELYLPADAVERGLSYAAEWSPEEGTIVMTALDPDRKALPYAYDYRKEGRVPQVKNQGTFGTCWSFASLMALETTLLPEENLDFSEDHMSIRNSFGRTQDEGGEYTMSMAYLLAWQGPVLESEDPYGDGISPENLKPAKHVQEIQILPSKDYEKIKEAVYLYGGVQSSLYTSLKNYKSRSVYYNRINNSYCYIGPEKPNHDVVIVGWDDNYPKENFNMDLEGNGAFICINSWGEDFGEDGYFYVSYYDTNIGIHNILYSGVEDTDNYSGLYQSDLCGWVGQLGYGKETAYFANVYTAEGDEDLEAAGFYATGPQTEYEVFTARNVSGSEDFKDRKLAAKGTLSNAGYYTIPFDQPVALEKGERFAVIVKITTPGTIHPIAIEYDAGDGKEKIDLSDGEGYISYRGNIWENIEEKQQCNLCLKAYTTIRKPG